MTDKINLTTWTGQNIDAVVRFTSLIIKNIHLYSFVDNPLSKMKNIYCWTGRMTTETSLLITWRDDKSCFWCIETEETFSKAIIEEAGCYIME